MLVVKTISKIQRMFWGHHSIREISRQVRLSRKVVRRALRSDIISFAYKRQHQPWPWLDGHIARLYALPAEELAKPKREQLSLSQFKWLRSAKPFGWRFGAACAFTSPRPCRCQGCESFKAIVEPR
ncbi:hypothetical protein ABIE45_003471 [Methylobacterium sp. OAE515]|uniref:hypothetical protein n=1 Tax=Methylobacterium sp. OAE515 TaxID=2817895 RepID=UPI0017891550